MAGCRIGKVKFKSGAEVHVLDSPSRYTSRMATQTRHIVDYFGKKLDGFLVVGWDSGAEYIVAYDCNGGVITPTLLPSWAHDLVLRQVTENGTIEELSDAED